MAWLVTIVFVGCALTAAYFLFLRPMWMQYDFFKEFVSNVDNKTVTWWQATRIAFHGWASKMTGRFYQFAAGVVSFHDLGIAPIAQHFAGLDWQSWIPDNVKWWLLPLIFGTGVLIEVLRSYANTSPPTTVAGQVENVVAAATKMDVAIAPQIQAIPIPDAKVEAAVVAGELAAKKDAA